MDSTDGIALAALGVLLFTQLDVIQKLRVSDGLLNAATLGSMAATAGGFLIATVGSAVWARHTPSRQPLKIAALIGAAILFLSLLVDVNVHGPSSILILVVLFSAMNSLSLLVVIHW